MHVRVERPGGSVAELRDVLRRRSGSVEVFLRLGDELCEACRWEHAILAYREAIRLEPTRAELHKDLGDCLAELGRYPAAIDAYTQALRLDPRDGWTLCPLGRVLEEVGRVDEAIARYQQAIRLHLDDDPITLADAHGRIGILLRRRGQTHKAIRHLYRAGVPEPVDAEALYELGLALNEVGRLARARMAWEAVLSLPDGAMADKAKQMLARYPETKSGGTGGDR